MAEEKTDYSKENKKRMLAALAVYLGLSDTAEYGSLSDEAKKEARAAYEEQAGLKDWAERAERLPEKEIQVKIAQMGMKDGVKLYKIKGEYSDGHMCPKCKEWQGKIVSMTDNPLGYPLVEDFINSGGLHINCRCSLQELSTDEIPRKARAWLGMNSHNGMKAVHSGCRCKIS